MIEKFGTLSELENLVGHSIIYYYDTDLICLQASLGRVPQVMLVTGVMAQRQTQSLVTG